MKKKSFLKVSIIVVSLNLFSFMAFSFYNPPACLLMDTYPTLGTQPSTDLESPCYMFWNGYWTLMGYEVDCVLYSSGNCYEYNCDLSNFNCTDEPY